MAILNKLMNAIPEVKGPDQKLGFKDKLTWTLIILVAFFLLGVLPLYGLGQNALQQFEQLSIILGASFGSIISLGIGPIVTASIVLQLLNGSGIWKFDLTSHEGKKRFQGTQKLFSIFFIILEGAIYVLMGGLSPSPIGTQFSSGLVMTQAVFFQFQMILILQLFIGGVLIMFMDEIVSKWGFGSGISLFIAAGVAQQVFIGAFSFIPDPQNPDALTGAVPVLFQSLASGDPTTAFLKLAAIIATIAVFFMAVYVQAMKVEIPLSFGRIRGHGIRWPLNFLYTSNIPVILVAALLANIQLVARLLQNWGHPVLGTFSGQNPASGLVLWVTSPQLINSIITGSFV